MKSTIIDAPTDRVWAVLRDFNGHDQWHPAVATSLIERGQSADKIGCVRRFRLADGSELREQLLGLSDFEQSFSYCLLGHSDSLVQLCGARPPSVGDRRRPNFLALGVPLHDPARR